MTIICLDFVVGKISTMEGVAAPAGSVVEVIGPLLASLVYPIEVIEGFNVTPGSVLGSLFDSVGSIDVNSDLVSGALVVTIAYKTHRVDAEAIDVNSDLVSGALTVTIAYQTLRADAEGFDVASDHVSGDLAVTINYITHLDPADDEEFDVASDFVSGTLT